MDILNLTTTQAVRAVLGLSAEADELGDAVFSDVGIEDELELSLSSWLPVAYTTILVSGTSTQIQALRICAKYSAALIVLPSLMHAVALKQGDGQNEFQRNPQDIKQLQQSLEAALGKYQQMLLLSISPESVSAYPTWVGRAVPAFDPVTG